MAVAARAFAQPTGDVRGIAPEGLGRPREPEATAPPLARLRVNNQVQMRRIPPARGIRCQREFFERLDYTAIGVDRYQVQPRGVQQTLQHVQCWS